ncbi:MAG: hypothetical protein K5622_04455 [Endomicrobiaceae bacterium]|nr:hypothetical protein [Endomicrobiaceae bacterium]
MKNKKILSSILALTVMFTISSFVQAKEPTVETEIYKGISDFEDMVPSLNHNEPYVDTVISCNMVLKPKTQIHLSRLCDSAVTNVNYYFNGSGSVQKGTDYSNTTEDEVFYPATKRISNSYLGGKISYIVGSELQTKKSTGDKISLETPNEYKTAVIISSKSVLISDLGQDYTLEQPTGDQSQPNYVAVKPGVPAKAGRSGHWTVRFGTLSESASGVVGLFKSSSQSNRVFIIGGICGENLWEGEWEDQTGEGTDTVAYWGSARDYSLNDEQVEICTKAKRLLMEYNLDPNACDGGTGEVLTEQGWVAIDASQASQFLRVSDGKLYYPIFDNAWGRIYAVMTEPSNDDYRPAKRARVKSRIETYGGFKFNNLVDGDVVKIYTTNGKKIAELTAGESSEGFEWKGRQGTNNSGDWAKSGIYIYQIKLKDKSKIISGTIVLAY